MKLVSYLLKLYAKLFLGLKASFYLPKFSVRILVVERLIPNWAWAQAIGDTIFLRKDLALKASENPEIFCNTFGHELVHVEQARRYGLLRFAFLYFASSVYSFLQGKHYYFNNRFEVEAYDKQYEYCKKYVESELDEIQYEIRIAFWR